MIDENHDYPGMIDVKNVPLPQHWNWNVDVKNVPLPQHWNWNIDFKNPPSLEANLKGINRDKHILQFYLIQQNISEVNYVGFVKCFVFNIQRLSKFAIFGQRRLPKYKVLLKYHKQKMHTILLRHSKY